MYRYVLVEDDEERQTRERELWVPPPVARRGIRGSEGYLHNMGRSYSPTHHTKKQKEQGSAQHLLLERISRRKVTVAEKGHKLTPGALTAYKRYKREHEMHTNRCFHEDHRADDEDAMRQADRDAHQNDDNYDELLEEKRIWRTICINH